MGQVGTQKVRFSIVLIALLSIWVGCLGPETASAQNARDYLYAWAELLPETLSGFEADAPLVMSEGFKQQRYYSVSRIFYKADGTQSLEVSISDYSVNPDIYTQQMRELREAYTSDTLELGTTRYHGYLMQRNHEKNKLELAVYLGENLVVKVVQDGKIEDEHLAKSLLNRIALKRIKDVKDEAMK